MKSSGTLTTAIEQVLSGRTFFDPGMVPFMQARGAFSPEALVKFKIHLEIWLALIEGETSIKDIARRVGSKEGNEGTVQNATGEMRAMLRDLDFVHKPKVTLQDLAGFAVTHKLFFLSEYRRRTK